MAATKYNKRLQERIDNAGRMMIATRGDFDKVAKKCGVGIDQIKNYLVRVNWSEIAPKYSQLSRMELTTVFRKMRKPNKQDLLDYAAIEEVDLPGATSNPHWEQRAQRASDVISRRKRQIIADQLQSNGRLPTFDDDAEKELRQMEALKEDPDSPYGMLLDS